MRIKFRSKYFIIIEMLCICFTLISLSPLAKVYGFRVFAFALVMLLSFLGLIFFNHIKKKLPRYFIGIYIWSIFIFINVVCHRSTLPELFSAISLGSVGILFLILNYSKCIWERRRIIKWIFLCIIFMNIYTLIALMQNPQISREIANINKLQNNFSLFIGGYDYIYAVSLLSIALFASLRNNIVKQKWIYFVLWISCVLVIIYSRYTFAILITGGFTCLAFLFEGHKVKTYKIEWVIIPFCIVSGIVLVPAFLQILVELSGGAQSQIGSRINDLYNFVTQNELASADGIERVRVYQVSIDAWKQHIWFGNGGISEVEIGGHSDIFDMLAKYGVIGFLCFFSTFIYLIKNIANYMCKPRVYYYSVAMFLTFMVINPVWDIQESFMLFFFIPLFIIVTEEDNL